MPGPPAFRAIKPAHFRTRLGLPNGRIATAVHTFGDYLVFHPHLHVLAADGLFDEQRRFHSMPGESLAPVIELFRHRFLHALRAAKRISAQKVTELLSWKHSGFHIDGGEKPVAPGDAKGRQRLAEYLLRAPFSLQKIHWNPKTHTVLYRSRPSWKTKRNFEVFKATDFLAAAIDHIPPRGQQTIRYYGVYLNKSRGMPRPSTTPTDSASEKHPSPNPPLIPPPPKVTARAMRPLWRDLILRVWWTDPLLCLGGKATLHPVDTFHRSGEIEFFLRLLGLWEGIIDIPPPPTHPSTSRRSSPLNRRGKPSENGSPTTMQIPPATFLIKPPADQGLSKFAARTPRFWSSPQINAATPP